MIPSPQMIRRRYKYDSMSRCVDYSVEYHALRRKCCSQWWVMYSLKIDAGIQARYYSEEIWSEARTRRFNVEAKP